MGRVLTVSSVFLLLGIQPFVDIPAEREVQSVSADVEQTEEIRPKIALTFDDGPSAAYTEKLLDVLIERDVHATFFLIGKNIEKGAAHIRSTFNNTIVTITDTAGKAIY